MSWSYLWLYALVFITHHYCCTMDSKTSHVNDVQKKALLAFSNNHCTDCHKHIISLQDDIVYTPYAPYQTPYVQKNTFDTESEESSCACFFGIYYYCSALGEWIIDTQIHWTDTLLSLQQATIKFAESRHTQ